jgi:hypothetical protein
MMLVVLIAGIGLLLAGLVTVALGIQLDLSFGNTLILTGAVVACTGVIMLALWTMVRELKTVALQLGPGIGKQSRAGNTAPAASLSAALGDQARKTAVFRSATASRRRNMRAPNRRRSRQRHRGSRRPARAIAGAATRHPSLRPRRPQSRSAICCSPRRHGRSANAPRRERPTPLCPIFVLPLPPRPRLTNQAKRRRQRSTTPGQNRSVRGLPMRRCHAAAAAAARHRH